MSTAASFFPDVSTISAHAASLGERIDTKGLEGREVLALSPFVIRVGPGCGVVFRYGVVVTFQLDDAERSALYRELVPIIREPFAVPDTEAIEISIDADRDERVDVNGILSMQIASVERLQVVAEVLAKSTALAHFEVRVSGAFDRMDPVARGLRAGTTRMSGRELQRQLSDILATEAETVGRLEVTEKPEITWDRPDLDRLYERLGVEFELRDRDLALSRKLDLLSRTTGTLLELLQHRQGLRVEWYIVILILAEIMLVLFDVL